MISRGCEASTFRGLHLMKNSESNRNCTASSSAEQKAEELPSTFSALRQAELADTVVPQGAFEHGDTPPVSAFGRYRVDRLLGKGGMGSVYLGYDEQLDRQVALKVPHARLFQSPDGRATFLREARTLAQLEHPRIISVFDAGQTDDGQCYVVFRYVEGQTLAERLRSGRLTPREATQILADVADTLHYAHKRGFVHRDIKPSNILIDAAGHPWVADFGLAVAESNQRGFAGEVSGTPAYMSPEQTRGHVQHLDGRTDIWSVGVMLYEMLTGRRPFTGDTVDALFEEIALKEIKPIRMIDETLPEELERIVHLCLRKSVGDRYATAQDLARDLKKWGQRGQRPLVFVGSVAGTAVLLTALFWGILRFTRPVDTPHETDSLVAESGHPAPTRISSELLLLVQEMRGLRRDLGDTGPSHGAAGKPLVQGSDKPEPIGADTVSLPAGEWAPIPLPAGFTDLDSQLREARAASDEDGEEKLLLKGTNDLIDAGHFAIAEHLAMRMVELAGNDPSDVPFAYGQLGLAQYRQGRFGEAIASYQRSADVYQGLYDRMMQFPDSERILEFRSHLARLLGMTIMRIGNVHKAADDTQLARSRYDKARTLLETHDRQQELATLLLNFGGLESNVGNYEQAMTLLQQGLAIVRSNGQDQEEAEFLVNLGNAVSRGGDNSSALKHYQAAYQLLTPASDYSLRTVLLANWSTTLLEQGDREQARKRLLELQAIIRPGDTDSERVLEFLPALDTALEAVL